MIETLLDAPSSSWATAILFGLLTFTAQATVILLGAWGVSRLLRAASAATRHLVWTAGIVGVLALPLLSVTLPKWKVPVASIPAKLDAPVAAPAVADTPVRSAVTEARATVSSARSSIAEVPTAVASTDANAPRWAWPSFDIETRDVAAAAWLAIALLLVVRLAIANARVLSWKRTSRLVEDTRWNALLRRLTRQHGIERPVVLLENASTDVPVTWGIVYPVVLLPAAAAEWDEEQRVAVLTHELAHVKRFDALSQMLGQLALALLWFHPLAWMAVRRMRLEREHACDDFVLVAGARASRYADDLLGLARRLARPTVPAAAALAMARRSELEGRLLAILDPTAERSAVRRARAGLLTAAAILLAMPLAAFQPAVRVVTIPVATPSQGARTDAPAPAPQRPTVVVQRRTTTPATAAPTRRTADSASALLDSPDHSELQALLRDHGVTEHPPRLDRIKVPQVRAVRDTEPVELQTLVDVARGAKRMTSDYEKGQLLALIAKKYVRSDSLRDAYLDAVFSMTSDYERSKALIALLERDSIPATHTAIVLRAAAKMTSDVSRSAVLKKISPATFADSTVQRAYVDVINSMTSNTERAGAIITLVKQDGLSQGVQLALLRGIGVITGNTEKGNTMIAFLEHQGTSDPVVRRAFLKTAEGLTSDYDYRRVMTAMMR